MITVARRFTVPIMVAGALALASCGDDEQESASTGGSATTEEAPAELTKVVYAQPTPPTLLFYPALVAEELGFFEAQGVDAELAPAAEEISSTAFLDNGDADVSFADVDEIVLARSKGGEHISIYSPQHRNTAGIVVPADSDIQDFSGVAGKKVGLAAEEDTALFLAMMDAAGIDKSEVETAAVGTSGPLLAKLFADKEIDAYVGAVSDFTALGANGIELRNITPDDIGRIDGNPVAILPKTIEEKGDAIVGFFRAYAMAQHLGQSKPEIVEAIVRKAVPAEWRNEASGEAALKLAIELMTPDDPERIGDVRADVWETGQDILFRAKILEVKGDVAAAIDTQHIEAINDFDRAEVDAAADEWMAQNG